MSECSNDCASCGESCADRTEQQIDFRAKANELSHVKKVIAVVSGKGGVGKSLVTSMLAVLAQRARYKAAILDADVRRHSGSSSGQRAARPACSRCEPRPASRSCR